MTAREGLAMAGVALEGIDLLHDIANLKKPAEAVLEALKAALLTLKDGAHGKTSPQVVLAEIDQLRTDLLSNDAAADSELDRKFPT